MFLEILGGAVLLIGAIIFLSDDDEPSNTSLISQSPQIYSPVRREVEILQDCMELVNTSAHLKTVCFRYIELLASIDRLLQYSPEEIAAEGINIISNLPEKRQEIIDKKVQIFNAAIDREYKLQTESASKLKTARGRINRINTFVENAIALPDLPKESIQYLQALRDQYVDDIKNP